MTFRGMGKSPEDVVITNSLNAKQAGGTFFTETVEINGTGFEADNLTFENTAGNTGQAVAVANRGDRSIFKTLPLPRPSGHPLRRLRPPVLRRLLHRRPPRLHPP